MIIVIHSFSLDQEGLPAYWGIETYCYELCFTNFFNVSGRITRLLGYWNWYSCVLLWWWIDPIRKDYPLTGVLKQSDGCFVEVGQKGISGRITRLLGYWNLHQLLVAINNLIRIRKDYPLTGVLKLSPPLSFTSCITYSNQEGLPAYWGIETLSTGGSSSSVIVPDQEGLPAYWGIETRDSKGYFLPRDI